MLLTSCVTPEQKNQLASSKVQYRVKNSDNHRNNNNAILRYDQGSFSETNDVKINGITLLFIFLSL